MTTLNAERWRRPAVVLDVEHDTTGRAVIFPDGTVRPAVVFVVDDETMQRVKEGWICLQCMGPQEFPFPKLCNTCGYKMRERQTEDLATEYIGEARVGSRIKLQDEIDRMTEFDDFERRTGIEIPRNVRDGVV